MNKVKVQALINTLSFAYLTYDGGPIPSGERFLASMLSSLCACVFNPINKIWKIEIKSYANAI